MENEEKAAFVLKVIIIIFGILLISPFIVSILSIWPKTLTFIEFNSSIWIGFWGSYLGGIIGTIGVVYVARLQNVSQLERLNTTEENERKRLKDTTLISMLRDYHEILEEFHDKFNVIDTKLITIYSRKKQITESNFMVKYSTEIINDEIIADKIFLESTDKNFERPIRRIIGYNNIFKSIGIDVKDSSTIKNRDLINGLFMILETFTSSSNNVDKDAHKIDLKFIDQSLEDLISYPKDDDGNVIPIGIILKPYDELIKWLTEEIELTNKNIISLLNGLSTSDK